MNQAERDALRDAMENLGQYTEHQVGCSYEYNGSCSCGLEDALNVVWEMLGLMPDEMPDETPAPDKVRIALEHVRDHAHMAPETSRLVEEALAPPAPAGPKETRDTAGEVWDVLLPWLILSKHTEAYDAMRTKFPYPPEKSAQEPVRAKIDRLLNRKGDSSRHASPEAARRWRCATCQKQFDTTDGMTYEMDFHHYVAGEGWCGPVVEDAGRAGP